MRHPALAPVTSQAAIWPGVINFRSIDNRSQQVGRIPMQMTTRHREKECCPSKS